MPRALPLHAEHEPLRLTLLAESLVVARLPGGAGVPDWLEADAWHSITRTPDELSVVCEPRLVPEAVERSGVFRALMVQGPLDFELTGILHRITAPLAADGISLFAVSTYDTDYILVPAERLGEAAQSLQRAGIVVQQPD